MTYPRAPTHLKRQQVTISQKTEVLVTVPDKGLLDALDGLDKGTVLLGRLARVALVEEDGHLAALGKRRVALVDVDCLLELGPI